MLQCSYERLQGIVTAQRTIRRGQPLEHGEATRVISLLHRLSDGKPTIGPSSVLMKKSHADIDNEFCHGFRHGKMGLMAVITTRSSSHCRLHFPIFSLASLQHFARAAGVFFRRHVHPSTWSLL